MALGENQKTALGLIVVIFILVVALLLFPRPKVPDVPNPINELENQIDSIKRENDSIRTIIDTIYIQQEVVRTRYEKTVDSICTNTVDDNVLFFTDYIARNKDRLDSICDSRAN